MSMAEEPAHQNPTISIAPDTRVTNAEYLGVNVAPFRGVVLNDADGDVLTVSISFDSAAGTLFIPWGPYPVEEQNGILTYTLTGDWSYLTDLLQNAQYNPEDYLNDTGQRDVAFTITVKDDWSVEPSTDSVTVTIVDSVPPSSPPVIYVPNGTQTTYAPYTAGFDVYPFEGFGLFDSEDDNLTLTISFNSTYGDLIWPSGLVPARGADGDLVTYVISGRDDELAGIMRAVKFDPRNSMNGSGYQNTNFSISVADGENDPVFNYGINVTLFDASAPISVDPNKAEINAGYSGTNVSPFRGVNFGEVDGITLVITFDDAAGDLVFPSDSGFVRTLDEVGHPVYTISNATISDLTSLMRQVKFNPRDSMEGSGPITTKFTLKVKDAFHEDFVINEDVQVITDNGDTPNAPTTIEVKPGWEVTRGHYTDQAWKAFGGVSFDDANADDILTLSISFELVSGDLVIPEGTAFQAATDASTGTVIKTYTFTGTANDLSSMMIDVLFKPDQEKISTGQYVIPFDISLTDHQQKTVTNSSVRTSVNGWDGTDPATIALAPGSETTEVTHTGSSVHPFTGVTVLNGVGEESESLTVVISFDNEAGDLIIPKGRPYHVSWPDESSGEFWGMYGQKTYTFTGTQADLTSLMDQIRFDPFNDVTGRIETVFTIGIKEENSNRYGFYRKSVTVVSTDATETNAPPTILVTKEETSATDTGAPVSPFTGVSFDDAENDTLTVTVSFSLVGGDLILPDDVQPSVSEVNGIKTYTFTGTKAWLNEHIKALQFDPAQQNANSGPVTTVFTIGASDASNTTPVTNRSVKVVTSITDTNHAPANLRLQSSTEGVSVAESATVIGTLSAEDQDDDAIEWFFAQDGNPGGMFVIDGNTIKLAEGKQLDVDGPGGVGSYTIHVKAVDNNGGETTKTFVIAVTNVNDNAPATIRLNGQTSLNVAESTRVGDLIGTLTATDADGSSIVSYAMEANAFFEIVRNAETGAFEVRLRAGVDYETAAQRAHVLRITAFDGVNTSAPQDITINVTNVNEAPTGLVAEGGLADDLTVSEHTTVGAVIAALSGQDPDAGETFTYTLVTDVTGAAAASHPFFEIVGDKILLKAGLDDNQIGAYDLWVKVTDAGGLSTVRKVTFTVANVDEKPSGLVVTGGTVAEGAPLHTVAAALAGLDPDAGETFTYHLVTDNTGAIDATHALFEIVDNQIRVKAGLDDAQVGTYNLWVKVTDANDLSTVEKVTITVSNVNEAPTSLLLSNTVVYESSSIVQVGTLSAVDADGDTLRYDLVDTNGNLTDAGPFEILTASASGAVRLATKTGIQVSSDETYVVYIKVSDGKGGSLIKDFGITIKDVNVAPTKPTLSNTVVDESDAAIKIGMLNTTDADGDELTYILVDVDGNEVTDKSPFEIQEIRANGVKVHRLATKAGIQVEGDEERDVWIRVSDGKSSVTEKFTITIRDVAYTPTNVAPTLFIASDAANVRASDLDGPIKPFMGVSFDDAEDDVLTVSVSFDPAGGDLVLTPETWATSVAINPETGAKTYTFTGRKAELAALMDRLSFDPIQQPGNSGAVRTVFKISVKDALHDAVSDYSLNVVTAITNKNHAPEGIGLGGSLVSENAGAGTLVGILSAQDRDAGDTLVYTLSDDRFYIDGNQLKVKDGSKLDFEAAQSHQITILVSDGVTSVGQTYTINIGDMVETLTGTKGKDLLQGGAGSDMIKAEYGNDTLLGNAGQDFFVFNTKLGTSKTDRKVNFNTIKDFKVVDDSIWLDDKIFKNAALKKLGKGASEANPKQLTSKFFKIGNEAKDKDDYLIYNKKTGVLSYDADGSGSKHKALEFANIGKNLALTSKDFFII